MAAFRDDLAHDGLPDRVIVMTSPNSAGPSPRTDVMGGLTGQHPSLNDLDNDALKPHTNLRSVYAPVLESWPDIPAGPILGPGFTPLDVVTT